jgi:hypothetical protein
MSDNSNKGLIIGGSIVGGIVLLIVILIGAYSNAVAFGSQQEQLINATWENNKNILGTYTTKVAEMAQVPAMARDDLSKVISSSMTARYGADGSTATMQWIKENYPGQVDNKLYERIQATIDAGRTDFQTNQTTLLDEKRVYQTNLNYLFKGALLKMAGYPKTDLSKFNIVTSTSAEKSFSTGTDDGVTLRKPDPAPAAK